MKRRRFEKDFKKFYSYDPMELNLYLQKCSQYNTVNRQKNLNNTDPWADWTTYPLVSWPKNYPPAGNSSEGIKEHQKSVNQNKTAKEYQEATKQQSGARAPINRGTAGVPETEQSSEKSSDSYKAEEMDMKAEGQSEPDVTAYDNPDTKSDKPASEDLPSDKKDFEPDGGENENEVTDSDEVSEEERSDGEDLINKSDTNEVDDSGAVEEPKVREGKDKNKGLIIWRNFPEK